MPEYSFNGNQFELGFPAVMGILNATPDSFSDGGLHLDPKEAVARVQEMAEEGAAIIDLGGESTRPGSEPVSIEEELKRVLPILEALPKGEFMISIDSRNLETQRAALEGGAHLVNDVSGGTEEVYDLAEEFQAGLILMHAQGDPKNMQNNPSYEEVVTEVKAFFDAKKGSLRQRDLPKVWIDPGIGFGKTTEHNLELMRNLNHLADPDWGILLGSSRKSWIGQLCGAPVDQRLGGSLASAIHAVSCGAEIIRAHDVRETVQAIAVGQALTGESKPEESSRNG
ncbi:MAG: dihydropteroate synthase [Opitutae bacterium]|nr:dihydropteroate synthase [Opitutae bacterium]MBG31138.1 dihydropteroate synthase [Opitutae bacterium]